MPDFPKFQPGQKHIRASHLNTLSSNLRLNRDLPRSLDNQQRDYDQVKVENGSGYHLDPFSVLKIEGADAATWPERTNELFFQEGMRNGIESKGSQPGDDFDQVAVLQKSAQDTMFTQGVISGPTPVFVYFPTLDSLNYPFAIPDRSGNKQRLVASPYGLNRILWHAAPSDDFQECAGEVLQAYVNLGEDQQWHFWKLKSDLSCCGSAPADACDECGNVYQPNCPITRTIWAPKGLDLCGCENACGQWKQGDVVPAWWYESLGKWVTIPNFHSNLEEQEVEVVTGLQITGGTITPSTDFVTVVTDVIVDTSLITLASTTPSPVYCSTGSLSLSNATASGSLTVTGNIGTSENPIQLDVVSACDDVTISNASFSSSSYLTLTGNLTGTAPVSVGLSGVEFDVTGTCAGTATGTVSVAGTSTVSGTCQITSTLPTLNVTGSVTKTSQAEPVTLSGFQKTFLTAATLTKPTLTLTQVPMTIPATSGSVTGSLGSISLSGLTVTLDLSSIFEEVDVVADNSFEFTGCTLSWQTVKAVKLKQGASLSNVTASLSGTIASGTSFSGTADLSTGASSVTINNPSGWSAGSLSTSSETVTVPTTATIDTQKLGVTGTATFPNGTTLTGTCSASGTCAASGSASLTVAGTITGTATGDSADTATGTATLNNLVSVSGMANIASGVTLRGTLARDCPQYARGVLEGVSLSTSGSVSLPVTGTISDTRECYVDVPTELFLDEGALTISTSRIALPTVDLTGATISGVTSTIKVLGCKECPEPEEEETEEPNA